MNTDSDSGQHVGRLDAVQTRATITESRTVLNQRSCRRTNEQVDRLNDGAEFDEYVCECGNESCVGPVAISHDEYDDVRRQPGWLVVRPGHWSARYDRVVRETPRYQIIEKIGNEGATPRPPTPTEKRESHRH